MPRNNKRWPLELDAGLRESVEQVLKARKKNNPTMNRNELLAQLIRRGLSDEAKAPVVRFNCADPLAVAQFRGDVDKMEAYFAKVRKAIIYRNRCVDRHDPEAVKKFKADDQQTQEFLKACKDILRIAEDRAWELRGFSANQVFAARMFLGAELKELLGKAEDRAAKLKQILDRPPNDTLPRLDDDKYMHRLCAERERIDGYQCALRLLNFVEILEEPVTVIQGNKPSPAKMPTDQPRMGNGSPEPEILNE